MGTFDEIELVFSKRLVRFCLQIDAIETTTNAQTLNGDENKNLNRELGTKLLPSGPEGLL